jgi:16S rRNA (cytosine967-C5)-methyltransferase
LIFKKSPTRSNFLQVETVKPVARIDKPRAKALEILRDVEQGAFADLLLGQARQFFPARDNAFILELVYGTLRNQALLDWALDQFSSQPVATTDSGTRNILRLGAYQMLFLDRVPTSAAVNTATELAKTHGRKSGYVNGLLRNLDRKRGTITYPGPELPLKRLSILYSHPEWLVNRWVARFGAEQTEMLLKRNNLPAPLFIRTNTLRTTREELKRSLAADHVEARETDCSPIGLRITSSPGLHTLTAYKLGWFMVQDQAAQLIGLLLNPKPGEIVLDACAAPGGKATHAAEIMKNEGTVIALESDAARIGRIIENSERLGLTIIRTVQEDATSFHRGSFDKILIDAPCSGLGVLRRHPDGRWSKSEETIPEKQAIQMKILKNCSALLKPGGALVYATCTTEPEENEGVVTDFLSEAGDLFRTDDPLPYLPQQAARLVDKRGFFHTYPHAPEMDGFFGARLVRKQ